MAIANTVQTYSRVGIREDLSDMIYDISPTATPFLTGAGRGKVDNTLSEWQVDQLAAPDSSNAVVQGADVTTFAAASPTARHGNYTQISRKLVIVADTVDKVKKAGRKSELAYQTAKRAKELKRDMETILLGNQAASAGSTSVAPTTGSLQAFIKTNVNEANDGVSPIYTSVPNDVRTAGTPRAFTKTILDDVLTQCWESGAEVTEVMVGAHNKAVASGFTGIAQHVHNVTGEQKPVIMAAADIYVSDFGTVKIVPNRWMPADVAYFLDYDFVSVDYLRPFKRVPLAKTGDAEKRMLITEYMLKVKNEQALGIAADLTSSL